MTIRTRFAPSPTGDLHIGGARTALFAWAFARANAGEFILRIEDTDRERHQEAAVAKIISAMEWLGLDYDDGPYYQSNRYDRYKEAIDTLLEIGQAYRCICSKEKLDSLREKQMNSGLKPKYDGCCREANYGSDCGMHVIRFRNPEDGVVIFDDMVRGRIEVANAELDDLIIARSDSNPTYNLTVVVDDIDMRITHVIRGDDHINNTPRQINIFKAFGAEVPVFAHVPSILAPDGKKLSKRTGAQSVMEYKAEGYLSAAVLNYLIRLGWSHGDKELFSRDEIINLFDIKHVQKSPSALNPDKLLWLNQNYIKETTIPTLAELLLPFYVESGVDVTKDKLMGVLPAFVERCKTLPDFVNQTHFLFTNAVNYDATAVVKFLVPEIKPALQEFYNRLQELVNWDKEGVHQVIIAVAAQFALKMGSFAQPVRVCVTGCTVSPSLDLTLVMLGREKVLQRLDFALTDLPTLNK
jgi:glutamyl-tRNA synthetase